MSEIEKVVLDVTEKLYGPRFCAHCSKVQPVKLEGSDTFEQEGMRIKIGFTDTYVCQVCLKPIKRKTP